ncbi:MAG: hypothetical protein R2811_10045 [Flavobacteriales bacterium]
MNTADHLTIHLDHHLRCSKTTSAIIAEKQDRIRPTITDDEIHISISFHIREVESIEQIHGSMNGLNGWVITTPILIPQPDQGTRLAHDHVGAIHAVQVEQPDLLDIGDVLHEQDTGVELRWKVDRQECRA